MKDKLEENIISPEAIQNFPELKISQKTRPNIDHLIKRILVERRSQERKNLIVFLAVFLVAVIIALFLYN
tara:strand:+ start:536 stop:745 length:210 start_codon:yes stop_codon:yes gene_type:complete